MKENLMSLKYLMAGKILGKVYTILRMFLLLHIENAVCTYKLISFYKKELIDLWMRLVKSIFRYNKASYKRFMSIFYFTLKYQLHTHCTLLFQMNHIHILSGLCRMEIKSRNMSCVRV